MKCKNCNGNLKKINNLWVCDSCGSQFSLNEYDEGSEVYICYVENDSNGRRSKDSLLAQELYTVLTENKIKTFYKRISLSESFGTDAQKQEEIAIENAKVVLLVGTSGDIFVGLWKEYSNRIADKIVIPVFQGMEASDLPNEINAIQALKYDKVGATADLLTGVLKILGRKGEDNFGYTDLAKKQKKNGIIIAVIIVIVILILGIGALVSVIVVKSLQRKTLENNTEEIQKEETESEENALSDESDEDEIYKQAIRHMDNGEYADAISLLLKLDGYKDSESLIHTCYAKYSGYYYDEESGINFHLQDYENNEKVEIQGFDDKGNVCSIKEVISFDVCESNFDYSDSENNRGKGSVILDNEGVKLSLKLDETNSDIFISDIEIHLPLIGRSDKPLKDELSAETLKDILNKNTTISDLKRSGHELTYDDTFSQIHETTTVYKVDNKNIYVFPLSWDLASEPKEDFYEGEIGYSFYQNAKSPDDSVIYSIVCPASIICPEKIGEKNIPYFDEDYIYYPDGFYKSEGEPFTFLYLQEIQDITDDTLVGFCCRSTVGDICFNFLRERCLLDQAAVKYKLDYNIDNYTYADIKYEDAEHYEIITYSILPNYNRDTKGGFYNVDKKDYRIEDKGTWHDDNATNFNYSVGSDNYGSSNYGDYILPDSADRLLTEADLVGLSTDELRKARNEIVARRGRLFNDAELQAYFNSKSWYTGAIAPDDFDNQAMLSDIERSNMEFIKQHE